MKHFITLLKFFLIGYSASAQFYYKAEQYHVAPSQVLLDQYRPLSWKDLQSTSADSPSFDPQNPYTYLQVIVDGNGKKYHLLMQTDFFGKALYVAWSENMNGLLNKEAGVFLRLAHCIATKKQEAAASLEGLVDCILETINAPSND